MNRLSSKILAVLFVVALVVTVVSMFPGGPTPEVQGPEFSRSELMYRRAGELLREGSSAAAESAYLRIIDDFPGSVEAEKAIKRLASISLEAGDHQSAIRHYNRLLADFPDTEAADMARREITRLNEILTKAALGTVDVIEYTVEAGDTLYGIARKFNTTIELIKKMNGLRTDVIRVGQRLKINASRFSIKVDIARNVLELKKNGELFKEYKVATGKGNSTPVGSFKVTEKAVEPVWTKPGVGMITSDHPEYELGARWIAISEPGYGIHGTNDESSIGGQTTAGCVRMYNHDVIELYDMIPVGIEVVIIDSAAENEGITNGDNA